MIMKNSYISFIYIPFMVTKPLKDVARTLNSFLTLSYTALSTTQLFCMP